jgi:hypothetical protein
LKVSDRVELTQKLYTEISGLLEEATSAERPVPHSSRSVKIGE